MGWELEAVRLASDHRGLLAGGLLFASSLYGLAAVHPRHRYARAGYRLNLYTGFLSLMQALNGADDTFQPIQRECWVWAWLLGLPLASSELVNRTGLPLDMAPLQLIVPFYSLLTYHVDNTINLKLLASSYFFNSISIAFTALYLERPLPVATASLFLLSSYWLSTIEKPLESVKAMQDWSFLTSIINLTTTFLFGASL